MPECRVFVSSPGDVALERTLVASVIERLRVIFGHRSDIRLILWEQMPLDANQSFQPQLPDPSDADLFLLILWRRIGTPLPDEALPEGFDGPLTGTEYEFLAATRHQQLSGRPSVLVYRKLDIKRDADNPVEVFFRSHFEDDQQRLQKAFHTFHETSEFEQLLEAHLHSWFDANLPTVSDAELAANKSWYQGNPFQGLNAFRFDHANVYRGRSALIADGIERLKAKAAQHQPFLLIMGMSGSGKSSLARAGILPTLYTPQVVPTVSRFYRGVMRPADIEGDPIKGLVSALTADSANNILSAEEADEVDAIFDHDADQFFALIHERLTTRCGDATLVILVDQLEELYTSASISPEQQQGFANLLKRLVEELGVWVIATMRSDCYHLLGDTPAFLKLKQDGGQLDVQPPELYSIRQMIKEPAELAQLHFEPGVEGLPPLDEVIAERAAESPESLPLLEFTLSQLYEARTPSGMLTFENYRKLGGIEGAIASHAESVFSRLERSAHIQFPRVFNQLAGTTEDGRYARQWVERSHLAANPDAAALVEAFLRGRLLVSELNPEGVEIVTLVHESLFRHWPRLARWLETNRNLLQIRHQIQEQARRWINADRDPALVLNAGKPLEDGKALLRGKLTLEDDVYAFIAASVKRAKRSRYLRIGAIASLVVVTVYALFASFSASRNQLIAERSLAKSQDLIEFLIGDLHGQLQKLGRLDVMQAIGEKALGYYAGLESSEATSDSLANRSRALYQIGSVYLEINQFDKASEAFSQSLNVLQTLVDKHPDNFDYLFELAQAEFWLGYTFWLGEDYDGAEQHFFAYQRIAHQLVALQPDSLVAIMEVSHAYSNLGSLADERAQREKAREYFLTSINFAERVLREAPEHEDAMWNLANASSWLGNLELAKINLSEAKSFYQKEHDIFQRLSQMDGNIRNKYEVILSGHRVASVYLYSGQLDEASTRFKSLIQETDFLIEHDPSNLNWRHLHADILSNAAICHMLNEDYEAASQAFAVSFLTQPDAPGKGDVKWLNEHFQREYWYWRLLQQTGRMEEAKVVAERLAAAEHREAQTWQLRMWSFTGAAPEAALVAQNFQIDGPNDLMAVIEYARVNNKPQLLARYTPMVSEEFWQYPELAEHQHQLQRLSRIDTPTI